MLLKDYVFPVKPPEIARHNEIKAELSEIKALLVSIQQALNLTNPNSSKEA